MKTYILCKLCAVLNKMFSRTDGQLPSCSKCGLSKQEIKENE